MFSQKYTVNTSDIRIAVKDWQLHGKKRAICSGPDSLASFHPTNCSRSGSTGKPPVIEVPILVLPKSVLLLDLLTAHEPGSAGVSPAS